MVSILNRITLRVTSFKTLFLRNLSTMRCLGKSLAKRDINPLGRQRTALTINNYGNPFNRNSLANKSEKIVRLHTTDDREFVKFSDYVNSLSSLRIRC